ncbi:OCR-like antirestriction protein [Streptomyces phage Lannister]|uniref:OCR-like antirestriction protein n=1 Tax=Streptomyces phage Lannister TaxID=1674927 RepID=A0A0K1YA18_9CAUD|nr:OCR-like antirestriction protein [Streptomyces phage Lannister]AKY03748.1 OCR-like antirestriction protein [Streptomyces phage Lannister]
MNIIEEIKQRGAFSLAGDAETLDPDSHTSAGAQFLTSVRDATIERIEWAVENDGLTLVEAAEDFRDGDAIGEVADGAPSIYTHQVWQEFVDLGAYREDLEPHDLNGDDLSKIAGIALYHVAWRLASVLAEEIIDNAEEN